MPTVLLVCPQVDLTEFFTQCLTRQGCQVRLVNAALGLGLLDSESVQLVVLDLHSAVPNWRQITAAARAAQPAPIPVLAILGKDAVESAPANEVVAEVSAILTATDFSLSRFAMQLAELLHRPAADQS